MSIDLFPVHTKQLFHDSFATSEPVANESWVEICRERVANKIEADPPAAISCREPGGSPVLIPLLLVEPDLSSSFQLLLTRCSYLKKGLEMLTYHPKLFRRQTQIFREKNCWCRD
jgi:hypothetical protein